MQNTEDKVPTQNQTQTKTKTKISKKEINFKMEKFYKLIERANLELNKHQYDGVQWCLKNELIHSKNFPQFKGGIIADEMGLGKTLLMIGIMYVNFMPQTLIILPPNLIQQWKQQIYKITGHKPLVYYGLDKKNVSSSLHNAPIVLTSYYTLFSHSQNGNPSPLFDIKWSRIIYDEGHHMRNKKTKIFRTAKDFNITSPQAIKYILTGTPIQNNNKDLKNLIQILGLDIDKKHPIYLEKFIKKYVLLRTKQEVGIQMPPLSIKDIIVDWQEEKELGYKLHKPLKKILLIQDEPELELS